MRISFDHNRLVYLNNPQMGGAERDGNTQNVLGEIEEAEISEQTKAYLRQWLIGSVAGTGITPVAPDPARIELVRRFLRKEIDENKFNELRYSQEQSEIAFNRIDPIRRDISRQINDALEGVESYREVVPHMRKQFDRSFNKLKKINMDDASVENNLRSSLQAFLRPPEINYSPGAGAHAVQHPLFNPPPTPDLLRAVYRADDATSLNAAMHALETALPVNPTITGLAPSAGATRANEEAAKQRNELFQKLRLIKNEEHKVRTKFVAAVREVDRVIDISLTAAARAAQVDVLVDRGTESTGISLVAGTEIDVREPDPTAPTFQQTPRRARITNVDAASSPITVNGEVIGTRLGVLTITVEDGGITYNMPLGRFKKWVDATDATQITPDINTINQETRLTLYGMGIEVGSQLSYVRHHREKGGEITRKSAFVRVEEIGTNATTREPFIRFNQEVQYAPGFEDIDSADMRDRLTLGQFLKWWRRYDADVSMNANALRQRLICWNYNENRKYGTTAPAISLIEGEELRYPCENGFSFRIKRIGDDGITLDNEQFMTFNDFFHWVERNHVEVAPDIEKTDKEREADKASEIFAKGEKSDDEAIDHHKEHMAEALWAKGLKYSKNKEAVDVWKVIKQKWYSTTFLSLSDVGAMYKEVSEFVKRRHERKSKGRYAQVGERLPGLIGVDFERAKEDAEHEEVGKYQHAMEHWGIDTLRHVLHSTNDKDVCKAAIIVLVGKGEMRWDDPIFWETINRLTFRYTTKGGKLHIPAPNEYMPGEHHEDKLSDAIDALWAKRQFLDWTNENKSKYNSNVSTMQARFKELEADPKGTGGPAGELQRLLYEYIETDKYVNPHEYESIIDGAIENGKMSAEAKMFYLIAGIAATPKHKDRHPHTPLLSFERLGEFNSKHLARFPMMDYFTQKEIEDPFLGPDPKNPGHYKSRKLNQTDFQLMMERYFHNDVFGPDGMSDAEKRTKAFKPGAGFSRYMWEKMLTDPAVRTRISKAMRSAENMDHDDAHMFIPPTDIEEMKKILGPSTGNKLYFTMEGYSNGYPGFNQWINVLTNVIKEDTDPKQKQEHVESLQSAINSFIIFDGILSNQYDRGEKSFARLDRHHYNRPAVTDGSVKMGLHQAQLRNLVMELAKAYGYADRFAFLYNTQLGSPSDPVEKKKIDDYKAKVDGLKEIVTGMINEDGGVKALKVIEHLRTEDRDDTEHGLRGIVGSRRPKLDVLQHERHDALHHVEHAIHHKVDGH